MLTYKFQRNYLMGILLSLSVLVAVRGVDQLICGIRWEDAEAIRLAIISFLKVLTSLFICWFVYGLPKQRLFLLMDLFQRVFPERKRGVLVCCISVNFALTGLLLVQLPKSLNSGKYISMYAADMLKDYETAENICMTLDKSFKYSFVNASRHGEKDIDGVKADDSRFDTIVAKHYGSQSLEMAERKYKLGLYYSKERKDNRLAIKLWQEALAIYKKHSDSEQCVAVLKIIARHALLMNNTSLCKQSLIEAEKITRSNSIWQITWYSFGLMKVAKELKDEALIKQFEFFNHKYLADTKSMNFKSIDWFEHLHLNLFLLIIPISIIIFECQFRRNFAGKVGEWKKQIFSSNESEAIIALNNLITFFLFRKNWNAVHTYTLISQHLNEESQRKEEGRLLSGDELSMRLIQKLDDQSTLN